MSQNGTLIQCDHDATGFNFSYISSLLVHNIQLNSCGAIYAVHHSDSTRTVQVKKSAIHLSNCKKVTFNNVQVENRLTGIVLQDCTGKIAFSNCTIQGPTQSNFSGHGVYIQSSHSSFCLTDCDTSFTTYKFVDCIFKHNKATGSCYSRKGGGLSFLFKGNSTNNVINIFNCTFKHNSAVLGGGMMVEFAENATGNMVTITSSRFFNNTSYNYGGGTYVLSNLTSVRATLPNQVLWDNCDWIYNTGKLGSAVAVVEHEEYNKTRVEFDTCFVKNNVVRKKLNANLGKVALSYGQSTVYVKSSHLTFKGYQTFSKNDGSAIFAEDSRLLFYRDSLTTFENNTAVHGGAIYLYLRSYITAGQNSTIAFISNSASRSGGAVFQRPTSDPSITVWFYKNCWFSDNNNTTNFIFQNNKAGNNVGHALFVATLTPCKNTYIAQVLSNYWKNSNKSNQVCTIGVKFVVTQSEPHKAIPGKTTELPFQLKDELNQTIPLIVCRVSLTDRSITFSDGTHSMTVLNCSQFTFYGRPGSRSLLRITTLGFQLIECELSIALLECPPGYVWSNVTRKCKCSSLPNNFKPIYAGIEKCDDDIMRAYPRRGNWFGYDGSDSESENNFIVANCPRCKPLKDGLLPDRASRELLDRSICGPDKTGILCGKCVENFTILFHNNDFECYPESKYCRYGLIFYILSEWIPVTLLFIFVLIFDISFTSGGINALIFFAQFAVSMQAEGWVSISPTSHKLMMTIQLIYKMLNLNFFSIHDLSFCIWKGATSLDILAMKYITIIYSLLLVTITVLAIEKCTLPKSLKKFRLLRTRRKTSTGRSVVHGLTSFFVMCYSQCSMVSISILNASLIKGKGDFGYLRFKRRVVFHNGEMQYFHSSYLPYAIPAIFFLIFFVILPPTLLIIYPLCYKVFQALHIKESIISTFCRIIPLEKLRPLFDSLQSSFKDNCRYFAGLYFFHRLTPLVTFAAIKNELFYGLLELQLIVMVALHSLCQPYKLKRHNRIDLCLLINLLLINTLSAFKLIVSTTSYYQYFENEIIGLSILQSMLFLLPIICVCVYGIGAIVGRIIQKCKSDQRTDTNDFELSDSLFDQRNLIESTDDHEISSSYARLEDKSDSVY